MFRSVAFQSASILCMFASMNFMFQADARPAIIQNAVPTTYYVNANAPSNGNGSSWKNAFNNLQSALAAVNPSVQNQIWVAQGTYKPSVIPSVSYLGGYTGNDPNLVTFALPSNVSIYGGFYGNETSLGQRNPTLHHTILSGDIRGDDNDSLGFINKSDNAWHVLSAVNAQNVLLDGLIVRDGYAGGTDLGVVFNDPNTGTSIVTSVNYAFDFGAGLFARSGSTITLNNVDFLYNGADATHATIMSGFPSHPLIAGGGAIGAIDAGTLVTITNCVFQNNAALNEGANGGAVAATANAGLVISNTSFSNNQTNRVAGAVHVRNVAPSSCSSSVFSSNTTTGTSTGDESGGALAIFDCSFSVNACTFQNNACISGNGAGGAIFFHVPFNSGVTFNFTVSNSTFVGNRASSIGGGAIIIFGILPNPGILPVIQNCTFVNNSAHIGGAINVDTIPVLIESCTFQGNQAKSGGAIMATNYSNAILGIYPLEDRAQVAVNNSVFQGNSIANVSYGPNNASSVFILDLTASASAEGIGLPPSGVAEVLPGGGAIASMLGGNVDLTNCIFQNNVATATVTGVLLNPPNPDPGVAAVGGAILAGGSLGEGGGTIYPMNQGYVKVCNPIYQGNVGNPILTPGGPISTNNTAVLDLNNLGQNTNGVEIVNSCN